MRKLTPATEVPERIVAVDVGGSKVAAAVVGEQGICSELLRFKTPECQDELLGLIGSVVLELADDEDEVDTIAVAWNGGVSLGEDGCMAGPLYKITEGTFDVGDCLFEAEPRLERFGVFSLNDAEAGAYGAAMTANLGRALSRNESVLYVNLGEGSGGDVIRNGQSLRMCGFPAEFGEMLFGQHGASDTTWGQLVSGEGIQRCRGNGQRSAKELAEDPSATQVWELMGEDLARGLAKLIPIFGPQTVVIGASVSLCRDRFHGALTRRLDEYFAALSADSVTKMPSITYVPAAAVPTLNLVGAFAALQNRKDEVVAIAPALPGPLGMAVGR